MSSNKETLSVLTVILSGLILSSLAAGIVASINLRRLGYTWWSTGFNFIGSILWFILMISLSTLADFGAIQVFLLSVLGTCFWTIYQLILLGKIKRNLDKKVDVSFITTLVFVVPAVLNINLLMN